ncbi:hypothetical protein F0562_012515 [Nyssa sinensis]|uniref:Leucine-rich repeat-containing N-terminal plant-type domain-containing protein n=1 Tax=Nyssa sinensis TaxID=561372 RepID=A0A5J4ZSW0_9ASTE|nr:hypothetical protein F0562_012515 [Nyssa sinensis]
MLFLALVVIEWWGGDCEVVVGTGIEGCEWVSSEGIEGIGGISSAGMEMGGWMLDSCAIERTILLNLKQQWGNLPFIQSWNSFSSPCDWPEIRCTNGRATGIILRNKNITEKIPPSICDLENLAVIDLAYNCIPGEFPTALYNCSKLEYLDLSQNYFLGPISAVIDGISTLRYIDLDGNNFNNDIPPAIGWLPELQTLYLYQNEFNGTFPAEIDNLSNIEVLGMAYNDFVPMAIPPEFGKLKKLKFMWMSVTNLINEIP